MNIFAAIKTSNYASILDIVSSQNKLYLQSRTRTGQTPLHFACYYGSIATVRLLLDKGVDVNALDEKGRTPLILATLRQNIMIVNMLLSADADINIRDTIYNRSALHYAVIKNNFNLARFLCKKGAHVDLPDSYYRSPAFYSSAQYPFLKLFIEDYDLSPNLFDEQGRTLLYHACKAGELRSFFLLLKHGARTNVVTEKERTLVHAAVKGCNLSILKRITNSKNINTPDKDGKTPIFFANTIKIMGYLVANEAKPNHADNLGNTPLHYCCKYNICEILLAFDARPNVLNQDNLSPMDVSRQLGNYRIATLMEIYSKIN